MENLASSVGCGGTQRIPNPVYLHGPAGTGKTHLVSALVERVTRRSPQSIITLLQSNELARRGGSGEINQTELQTVIEHVNDFEARMDAPGVTDLLGTLFYAVVIILLATAQAVAIVVIAYGFIAIAVCVLLGPVFIPFFIVPKLEWLFWGWLRCLVQYAFYQVIAAAVVFIIGNLILGILGLQPVGAISTVQLIEEFPVLFITFLAAIYALLMVPALTNHIFSGTAGGSSARLLESLVP